MQSFRRGRRGSPNSRLLPESRHPEPNMLRMICSHSASRSGPTRERRGLKHEDCRRTSLLGQLIGIRRICVKIKIIGEIVAVIREIWPERPESTRSRAVPSARRKASHLSSARSVPALLLPLGEPSLVTLRNVCGWKRKIAGGRPALTDLLGDSLRTYSVMINSCRQAVNRHPSPWDRLTVDNRERRGRLVALGWRRRVGGWREWRFHRRGKHVGASAVRLRPERVERGAERSQALVIANEESIDIGRLTHVER